LIMGNSELATGNYELFSLQFAYCPLPIKFNLQNQIALR